ncbi:MAG: Cobalamin import ATP-binding protein BtuD [Methanosaeta sp. PtaU1.Bin112]|nr:MAG: Cobalamin import ATP-binding protein BtuD [Methanosaeta sp. PtaU1.Bin112]
MTADKRLMLKVSDLVFAYSGVKILDWVSLELEESEVLVVIGPNGAGKSTLIRCMNRVLNPQSGTIALDGVDIRDMKRMEIARKLGYVPQASKNSFPATVLDTVLMGRRPPRWMEEQLKRCQESSGGSEAIEFAGSGHEGLY